MYMYKVLETDNFIEWLGRLKDLSTRIRLVRPLDKARLGSLGDVKALTGGAYEMNSKKIIVLIGVNN